MDGDEVPLKLVRLRCNVPASNRSGMVVARDVDKAGTVHFVLIQPFGGGRLQRFAVDASGNPVEPALEP
ncbi:MAG: hypothetical protein ACLQDQ_15795 [Myxococcaceae bacterium]